VTIALHAELTMLARLSLALARARTVPLAASSVIVRESFP